MLLLSIVFVLRASLTYLHRVYKFPASYMFPHSEYRTRLVFVSYYLTLPISNSILHTLRTSELYELCTSATLVFVLVLGTIPVHYSIPVHSGNSICTSIRNTLDATEGRCSARAEANSRKPPNFRISGLDLRRTRVAWATRNTTPILNVTLMLHISSLTIWVQPVKACVCCWICPHLCSGLRIYEHIHQDYQWALWFVWTCWLGIQL